MGNVSTNLFVPTVLVLILTGAGGALAQNEFFLYQSPCQVTVSGSLEAEAEVKGGGVSATDRDRHSFVTTHPIPSTTDLSFNGDGFVDASVSRTATDCPTTMSSSIVGRSTYSFNGDTSTMSFGASSRRTHNDSISRNPLGSGTLATAASDYDLPQVDAIQVVVPFQVAGGDNGRITVDTFSFLRSDSGPTTGTMIGAWQLFEDTNGNCQLDPGEQAIGGDAGIVHPNDTYTGPVQTMATPRGNYLLWLTYFTGSNERVNSANCSESPLAASDVSDNLQVGLRLN